MYVCVNIHTHSCVCVFSVTFLEGMGRVDMLMTAVGEEEGIDGDKVPWKGCEGAGNHGSPMI